VTSGKRDLEALIEEITVDCYGEDEELTGFLAYLEDALDRYRYWAGVDPWPAGATRRRGAGGGAAARR
jgi:hypothetical protein